MIGIKWDYFKFVDALNKINKTSFVDFSFGHFELYMKKAIMIIFINDLKGKEVRIIREAWKTYYEYGEFPSQCYMTNNKLNDEGKEYSEGNLTIQIINQGTNCSRHLVKISFKDEPNGDRITWMNNEDINQALEDMRHEIY